MLLTSCVSQLRPLDDVQAPEGGLARNVSHTVAAGANAERGRAKLLPGCLRLAPQIGASRQQAQLTA